MVRFKGSNAKIGLEGAKARKEHIPISGTTFYHKLVSLAAETLNVPVPSIDIDINGLAKPRNVRDRLKDQVVRGCGFESRDIAPLSQVIFETCQRAFVELCDFDEIERKLVVCSIS